MICIIRGDGIDSSECYVILPTNLLRGATMKLITTEYGISFYEEEIDGVVYYLQHNKLGWSTYSPVLKMTFHGDKALDQRIAAEKALTT